MLLKKREPVSPPLIKLKHHTPLPSLKTGTRTRTWLSLLCPLGFPSFHFQASQDAPRRVNSNYFSKFSQPGWRRSEFHHHHSEGISYKRSNRCRLESLLPLFSSLVLTYTSPELARIKSLWWRSNFWTNSWGCQGYTLLERSGMLPCGAVLTWSAGKEANHPSSTPTSWWVELCNICPFVSGLFQLA